MTDKIGLPPSRAPNRAPPSRAMVLAAGLGQRMRPLTATRPKPLVMLAGRALIDHVLDRLAAAGVSEAVVNVHYLADQIVAHTETRTLPKITISDERARLLDTGGGVVKALPLLGEAPFFHVNSDTVWLEDGAPALSRLAAAFDPSHMEMLLLLAEQARSLGYEGRGDFQLGADGRLCRGGARDAGLPVYMGVALLNPAIFAPAPAGAFSLNLLFDRAIARRRLFGLLHEGEWMHVGTPQALAQAESRLAARAATVNDTR